MPYRQLHNRRYLKENRRTLRNNLTTAEAFLWSKLQGRQLDGKKFGRQHSIANYIVDFYCPEYFLVIELDGEMHNTEQQMQKDRGRDAWLKAQGFIVLRFENRFVFENLDLVIAEIRSCFNNTSRFGR